jgi:hypothetical protein
MSLINKDITIKINSIINDNMVDDLTSNLKQRKCLNTLNIGFTYIYYIIQSSGILVTSIAISNNNQNLAWYGIGLNILSNIINIYKKVNSNIMKKLLTDIISIKTGLYIDEGEVIDINKNTSDN